VTQLDINRDTALYLRRMLQKDRERMTWRTALTPRDKGRSVKVMSWKGTGSDAIPDPAMK
jgi:hypothetical protein